jgi:hypothetical protein
MLAQLHQKRNNHRPCNHRCPGSSVYDGIARSGEVTIKRFVPTLFLLLVTQCAALWLIAQVTEILQLTPERLELHNVKAESVNYIGRASVRLLDSGAPDLGDAGRLAIIRGTSFTDGNIEIDLTGDTAPDAPPQLRGFVGIAFRVAADGTRFECFYLRPKNGRAQDQLQRNHSAQYISVPGFPWQKLRSESPGMYESYVDLVPGEWTKVRVSVSGDKAQLFVNGAAQPTLIVNDLKQPRSPGAIALWIGRGTIAHFANLKVAPLVVPVTAPTP